MNLSSEKNNDFERYEFVNDENDGWRIDIHRVPDPLIPSPF